ncbi:hypothetical protein NRIC_15940 [Enterococcus florum]|uniref:Uncharacterized protein n=1 Tax=Enterococcus florum TaxID=2480627 RepID=A0A4P5PK43_9ENTE|nr:hypothetical protein [Enterococcus florum]GCF93703.1 hypothetical protein NRIC_15940 [Enterococcus florum]
MNDLLTKLKTKIQTIWQLFLDVVTENERKSLMIAASLVFFSLLFSITTYFAQQSIRQSELEQTVFAAIESDHILPLEYGKSDRIINDTPAISVMFSQPNGDSYQNVMKILTTPEQEDELNRMFYYYPIVYDSSKIAQKYQIDPTKVTFIFFQKGKEKKRFVLEDLRDLNNEFIPELNRLPMWRLQENGENDSE